ncbi:hypothetical protein [Paraburkholderia solisilvae]|nr:hypothetical protein [Paraburkholderia solisilvae]
MDSELLVETVNEKMPAHRMAGPAAMIETYYCGQAYCGKAAPR